MQEKDFVLELGVDPVAFGLVLMGLVLFGLGFNWAVSQMGPKIRGRRAALVVGGVFGTLVGSIFVIGFVEAVLVGLCFVASGVPMIVGEWVRFDQQAQRERQEQALAVLDQLDGGSDA